ncbi:Acetoin dehydrogenase E1 component alpha-subunit (EC [Olavius sp. associated proteobacterium Delta 1]|nr:Acetoin dehydrogenase E1 component alpha-subunit (EC [Olavius sp. associated proteobacterium Delta 1]
MKNYSKVFLLQLYRTMLQIRLSEESLVKPILNGEVRCPVHLYTGQEAVATGVCAALAKSDYVFGNHRSHGHYLAKGGDLNALFAEIFGKHTGCARGRGGSMHVIDPENGMMGAAPIVGGTISMALGSALASKIRKDKRVAVSFFGDGATGEGVLYESLNFASLNRLPILFICENNLYATHMPIRECRVNDNIFDIGTPFGISSFKVDGNDVLSVYDVSNKAVAACRNSEGPAFIECLTYRMRGHVGPDDNIQGTRTDIRPQDEVRQWQEKDPIVIFRSYILKEFAISVSELDQIKTDIEYEVKEALAFAHDSPYPNPSELNRYVYKQ